MSNEPIVDEVDQDSNRGGSYIIRLSLLLISSVLLILLFVLENPTSGGPRAVIFALVLIFLILFQIVWLALHLITQITGERSKIKHSLLFSQLVAFSCIFLIGLKTLNQLSITDALLTFTLGAIMYFYIIRRF